MLAAMEDTGHTDTNTGMINRIAHYLANSPNETIGDTEFRMACIACDVDPDSFTRSDWEQLQRKLNKIT